MSVGTFTNYREIAQQTAVEASLLKNLTEGLRAVLAWEVQGNDYSRKLSTLLFISQSFKRHLGRLMNLEEVDGYMGTVLENKPFLSKKVHALIREHDRFRYGIRRIVQELKQVSAWDHGAIADIEAALADLLNRLDQHGKKEAKLFQEALEQEEGGEG
jgi:hypothetical protein